ncbi:MAG: hypothetical protein WCO44_13345 [Bacteroidota bacterium]
MKNAILFLFLCISFSTLGQPIQHPGIVLDTIYNNSRFIYSWNDGAMLTQAVDSGNFFSLTGSNIELTLIKKRIVGMGDTLIKEEKIQIRFADIRSALKEFFSDQNLKKAIREALEPSYKIKVSQE